MGERLFFRQHKEYVDKDTMQTMLDYCSLYRKVIFGKWEDKQNIGLRAFIEDKMVDLILTFKYGSEVKTYIFKKDCTENLNQILGMDAWKVMNQYYKVPRIKDAGSLPSSSAILYKNEEYENQRTEAIGYDLNSAYAWGLLQDMPDTSKEPITHSHVEPGQIGFYEDECKDTGEIRMFMTTNVGDYAQWIFDLIPSPFQRFVNRWYKLKVNAKDKKERLKAKQMLNFAVGYCQKTNPFIRGAVIGYINHYVQSLIDKNTLYCSTDSLVSKVKRPDIEERLGDDVGQWKIENQGYFAYKGFNHQWNSDVPSYRGTPKSWFKDGWDLLVDELPEDNNTWRLDRKKIKIKENKNGKAY